jgi:serine-type D-Ala-D-Ala carboxypeptidase/endopeptidase
MQPTLIARLALRTGIRILFVIIALVAGAARAFPPDAEVREMLRRRVEVSGHAPGLVVAIVDGSGSRVAAYGRVLRGSEEPVTGDSVFEVGSVTKVFTSLLLAQMAEAGEVRLDDVIAKYAPPSVRSPRARQVTLLHLSRHTAGFPLFPDNVRPVDPLNPLDVYSNEALFSFVNRYRTAHVAGTYHLYSNVGPALLGELLARRAKVDFETALRSRILEPLGMRRTGMKLTHELRAAHALGHTSDGRPLPLGDVRGMLGAGSLRTTGRDMARFLAANLGLADSSLAQAMRSTHETDADRQMPDLHMGLGWFHSTILGTRLVLHGGMTDGFNAYVGLDLAGRRGVAVLSNSEHEVQNIAIHLLAPSVPLYQPDPPSDRN